MVPDPTPTLALTSVEEQDPLNLSEVNQMNIQIGERALTATLVDNSSTDVLKAALAEGPLTIEMQD